MFVKFLHSHDEPVTVVLHDADRVDPRSCASVGSSLRPSRRPGGATQSSTRSTCGASADGNDDGTGDLAGVRARLPYLRDLGVDAIWFNPWYPSPLADNGYDVVDYRSIDPAYGTLAEAEELIAAARALGLRTIVDVVPNHVSSEHPWFREAVAAQPGADERSRFWFRPGKGADGAEPPNAWRSIFGGSAWTRLPDGEWYLHLFAPEQPDLNWSNPDVCSGASRCSPLLVRPRRRGCADRLGRAADQGSRPVGRAGGPAAGSASVHGP